MDPALKHGKRCGCCEQLLQGVSSYTVVKITTPSKPLRGYDKRLVLCDRCGSCYQEVTIECASYEDQQVLMATYSTADGTPLESFRKEPQSRHATITTFKPEYAVTTKRVRRENEFLTIT